MTSFHGQAFANLAVYRPSYDLTDGVNMALEAVYGEMWKNVMSDEWIAKANNLDHLALIDIATAARTSIVTLAAEVDRLRNELVTKGMLEGHTPVV